MPCYELAFLTRVLPRPEIVSILKRTANTIFENGGIIRRIDNLGNRSTPYKTSIHGLVHKDANYFIFEFDAPPSKLADLTAEYNRDVDIIKNRIFKAPVSDNYECKIEEEMRPAPYRPEVIKLIEEAKKKDARKPKFQYNTGLDYYPFQK